MEAAEPVVGKAATTRASLRSTAAKVSMVGSGIAAQAGRRLID
jgi:hypothetical protein